MGSDLYLERCASYEHGYDCGPDPRIEQYAKKAHEASQKLVATRQEIDELKGAVTEHERVVSLLAGERRDLVWLLTNCAPWRDEHTDKCFFCGDPDCGFPEQDDCADRKRAQRMTAKD